MILLNAKLTKSTYITKKKTNQVKKTTLILNKHNIYIYIFTMSLNDNFSILFYKNGLKLA